MISFLRVWSACTPFICQWPEPPQGILWFIKEEAMASNQGKYPTFFVHGIAILKRVIVSLRIKEGLVVPFLKEWLV